MKTLKKTFCIFITCCCLFHSSYSQHRFLIGINPFTLLEPQAGIGPSAEYELSKRFSLFAETNYLFNSSYIAHNWKSFTGYRFIFQTRYFITKQHDFFIAPEFRLKQFSYNSTSTFIKTGLPDSLVDISYHARQILIGGALNIGGQFAANKKKNLIIQIMAGIGVKQRYIKRNVPDGYEYYQQTGGFGLKPSYEAEGGNPYFPLSVRFMKYL